MNIDFKASASRPIDEIMENAIRTAAAVDTIQKRKEVKAPKKNKTPTYNFTLEQIEAMMNRVREESVQTAVKTLIELTLGLPVMVMHDKRGWRKGRLEPLVDDILELYNSYENGYLTLEDVREALWEEANIRIQMNELTKRR